MRIEPTDCVIGARVLDVSLRDVPTENEREAIEDALERYGVLVFPDQAITEDQQLAFTRTFGELMLNSSVEGAKYGHQFILEVGNTGEKPVSFAPLKEGEALEWHTDQIQYEITARASLLYAHKVPEQGGDTLFACLFSGYDALDDATRTLCESLVAEHSMKGLHDYLNDVGLGDSVVLRDHYDVFSRPLVRNHPRSGRPALYFGSHITTGIRGWSESRAREFIDSLTKSTTRDAFQYRHRWRVGDAVMWDNRRVLHAGTPYDMSRYQRLLHRTLVIDDHPAVA